LPVPQRGKAAAETAEYAKYAEVGTQFIPYSAYSAVPFVWEVARRLRSNWSIAVQCNPALLQPEAVSIQSGPEPMNRRDAKSRAQQSRSRNETRLNAETQRARRNAEEKNLFFLSSFSASLSESLRLCVDSSQPASKLGYSGAEMEQRQPFEKL
jgi:hypothetical protein